MHIGVALGSNLGNRIEHLRAATAWLQMHSEAPILCSKVYETAPIDCPENAQFFLNAVCEITHQGPLDELLRRMRQFERERGRPDAYDRNTPRSLDMDLLYADDTILNTPALTLPHPRLLQRRFVLKPLSDIRPDWVLPGQSRTVQQILDTLPDHGGVSLHPESLL